MVNGLKNGALLSCKNYLFRATLAQGGRAGLSARELWLTQGMNQFLKGWIEWQELRELWREG